MISFFFFFNDTATTEIYTLSLHDALPISEFGVDIAHSELLRDLGQIGRPFDAAGGLELRPGLVGQFEKCAQDRKSTRLNSSHQIISYAVFCLKKKKTSLTTTSLYEYF